jgi:hypothetical protein
MATSQAASTAKLTPGMLAEETLLLCSVSAIALCKTSAWYSTWQLCSVASTVQAYLMLWDLLTLPLARAHVCLAFCGRIPLSYAWSTALFWISPLFPLYRLQVLASASLHTTGNRHKACVLLRQSSK